MTRSAILGLARPEAVGAHLDLMILACRPGSCEAIDLGSGALVRAGFPVATSHPDVPPADPDVPTVRPDLAPFDTVSATIAPSDDLFDPARPEAVALVAPPQRSGRLNGRRARRYLEALLAPAGKDLLGFPGSAAPYWSIKGSHPSVSLVEPERGPHLSIKPNQDVVRCRFGWGGIDHVLPVVDEGLISALARTGRASSAGALLANSLGFRPRYLLVALTPPIDGRCYKTVAAALPKP
ncbi:MAG: hypothetical protein ACYCS7_03320 [Acidimicrobiales bacterium]